MSGDAPKIPAVVRTVVYAAGLAVGTAAVLVSGIAAVWWPQYAAQILATVGAATSATSFLAGALGVAYRPTGHESQASPARAVTLAPLEVTVPDSLAVSPETLRLIAEQRNH